MAMQRRLFLPTLLACGLALSTSSCGPLFIVSPENFQLIATDFMGGLEFIDGAVPPSLSDDGRVAFTGTRTGSTVPRRHALFSGNGGSLSIAETETAGYQNITAVQVAASGQLVFIAERTPVATVLLGAFKTDTSGSSYTPLIEGRKAWAPGDADAPPPRPYSLAMSPNGTAAVSTVVNAAGGLYRVPPGGVATLVRAANGTYFNTGFKAREMDVNDAGAIAVQMEYTDPNAGLSRGLLVFDSPGDTFSTLEATVMRQSVGVQPALALNGVGQMAFALNAAVTIQYFSPPLPGGGVPSSSLTLPAGVYLATPSAFGTPFTYTQIASTSTGYSNFGRIDVNDLGVVVFEAAYDGESGVFCGSDPVLDQIAITGRNIYIDGQRNFFSIVRLGQLNNHNQVAIQTSDYYSTDQKIWRIDDIK